MTDLSIDVVSSGERPTVALCGDLDIDSAPRLKEALLKLRSEGAIGFTLDLTRLAFIDSTGLGTLVAVWNALGNPPGGVRIASPSPSVARALAITGLGGVFPVEN